MYLVSPSMEYKPKLTSSKVMYLQGKKIEINCWKHHPKADKIETANYIKKCQTEAKQNKVNVSYYISEFLINNENQV